MRKAEKKRSLRKKAMKNRKKPFNKVLLVIPPVLVCLLLGAAALAGIRSNRDKKNEEQLQLQLEMQAELQLAEQREAALAALAEEEYTSVFFSMFSTPYILAEYFEYYTGIPTFKQDYAFSTTEEINEALDTVFSSGNDVSNIYLGLDPFLLYHTANDDIFEMDAALESGLLSHADHHPETVFKVILPFPSLDYWQSLSEGKFRISLVLYRMLTDLMNTRENIIVYFPGDQEWLIDNPGNYVSDFALETTAAHTVIVSIIAEQFRIDRDDQNEILKNFSAYLLSHRETPTEYPDLSQWEITFFGDSVFGNYSGSLSIPGAVNGLSGAAVYNCAEGGISAAVSTTGNYLSFPLMAELFAIGSDSAIPDKNFSQGAASYRQAKHTVKRRCFIINYGLNDYFVGYLLDNPENPYDASTYAGAIRTGIATLRERYPNALYIIAGPGQITTFDNGTALMGESQTPLSGYSDYAKMLSEELGTLYIDLYNDFPDSDISLDEVLADGVHYNTYGRYLFARKIVDLLAEQPPHKQIGH